MVISRHGLGKRRGASEYFETYLVATALDATPLALGPCIDNEDGRIRAIFAQVVVRGASGIDPQLQLQLHGALSSGETEAQCLLDDTGHIMRSTMLSLHRCLEKPCATFLDSEQFSRQFYPPQLFVAVALTGKNPAWTGHVAVSVIRQL